MEKTGFRGLNEHRAEHDRVLKQMHYVNDKVQSGKLEFGRAFVEDLPRWFDVHADTMDNDLAVHIRAQT